MEEETLEELMRYITIDISNGVATLTLNDPDKRNAINLQIVELRKVQKTAHFADFQKTPYLFIRKKFMNFINSLFYLNRSRL